MKLPRDLSGREGEHHLTIPDHRHLRVGALASILGEVATHLGLERSELVRRLFE